MIVQLKKAVIRPDFWVIAFVLFLFFPQRLYNYVNNSLDGSWAIGLQLALEKNMHFGTDFLFTYGPLGFLNTGLVFGVSKWVYVLYYLIFFTFIVYILKLFFKKYTLNLFNGLAIISGALIFRLAYDTQIWFFYCLFISALVLHEDANKRVHFIISIALALLLFFVKANSGIVAMLYILIFIPFAYFLDRISLKEASIGALSYILLLLFLSWIWRVDIIPYIQGSWHIINAYNDSMFTPEVFEESKVYILYEAALVLILMLVYLFYYLQINARKQSRQLTLVHVFVILSAIGLSYLIFKHNFTRGHTIYYFSLILMPVLMLYYFATPAMLNFARLIVLIVLMFGFSFYDNRFNLFKDIVQGKVFIGQFEAIVTVTGQVFGKIDQRYLTIHETAESLPDAFLKEIDRKSVDIIPCDIYLIYKHKLNYNPRPVIQSYSAYDEYLDKINADKYLSVSAPEYVIFTLYTIDNRYAFFDESQTKRALMQNYEIVQKEGKWILFKKRKSKRRLELVKTKEFTCKMGDSIALPKTDKIVYWDVQIRYSWLGKIQRFFVQPPALFMQITTEDKQSETIRVPVSILNTGLLVSNYILNNDLFAVKHLEALDQVFYLFSFGSSKQTCLPTHETKIKSIRFFSDTTAHYGFQPDVKIISKYYDLENDGSYQAVFQSKISQEKINAAQTSMEYNFEIKHCDNLLMVRRGWGFVKGMSTETSKSFLVFREESGKDIIVSTERETRLDVWMLFENKYKGLNLSESGFNTSIKQSNLIPENTYQLGLMIEVKPGMRYIEWVGEYSLKNKDKAFHSDYF
jgi:hypothetical protein